MIGEGQVKTVKKKEKKVVWDKTEEVGKDHTSKDLGNGKSLEDS